MTSFDWVILIVAGYAIYAVSKSLNRLTSRIWLLERRVEGIAFRLEDRQYLVPGRYRYEILDELYDAEPEHLRRLDAWSKTSGYGSDELTAFAQDTLEKWTRAQHPSLPDTVTTTACVTFDEVREAFRPLVSQTVPAQTIMRGAKERAILKQFEEKVQNYLTAMEGGGAFPATPQRAVEAMRSLQQDLLGHHALIRIHGATLMTRFDILMYFTLFDLLRQGITKAAGQESEKAAQ